jgi:hypothetical protein
VIPEQSPRPITRLARWRSSFVASILVALGNPTLVALGLAGFLARGGLIALAFPIVVLPTPAGLANVFAPAIVPFYFGEPSPLVTLYVTLGLFTAGTWLIVGGLVGAWADVFLIRYVTLDEEVEGWPRAIQCGPTAIVRVSIARLIAHLPFVIALAWGAARIYQAAFAELTSPLEVITPLVSRILGDAPDAIAIVLLAWLLGETVGGIAARHIVLGGRSTLPAVALGWLELVRRPRTTFLTLLATDALVLLGLAITVAGSMVAWNLVEAAVFDDAAWYVVLPAILTLVAAWLAGVFITGVAVTIRSAAWTVEWLRPRVTLATSEHLPLETAAGTIGSGDEARPGGWSPSSPSGTL